MPGRTKASPTGQHARSVPLGEQDPAPAEPCDERAGQP
jgi:hypothetical protein